MKVISLRKLLSLRRHRKLTLSVVLGVGLGAHSVLLFRQVVQKTTLPTGSRITLFTGREIVKPKKFKVFGCFGADRAAAEKVAKKVGAKVTVFRSRGNGDRGRVSCVVMKEV